MTVPADRVDKVVEKIVLGSSTITRPNLYKALALLDPLPVTSENIRTLRESSDPIIRGVAEYKRDMRVEDFVSYLTEKAEQGHTSIDGFIADHGDDTSIETFIDIVHRDSRQ